MNVMADGKYADHSRDFYLKEYECLRREIEWLLGDARVLERNVVFAVGISWGWFLMHPNILVNSRWAWFIPCLFAALGSLRAAGILKQFGVFHAYITKLENAFSKEDDPGGWEHFSSDEIWSSRATILFWSVIVLSTVTVAIYQCLAHLPQPK